jgi:hypothetical protein
MIKIRYRDPNELSPGLHAAAECHGRSTTVYLLSGLTAAERRAALRRLRLSARMGHCPRLPVAQLALALLADRIRTSAGHAGAVFRSHPAGSTVPVMVVSAGAIAFLLLSTVSIRVLHQPRPAGQLPPAGPVPSVTAIAEPMLGAPRPPVAGGLGQLGSGTGQVTPAQAGSGGSSAFTAPTISSFGTGPGNPVGSVDGTGITSPDTGSDSTTSGSTPTTGSTTGTGTGTTTSGSGSGSTTGSGDPTPTPVPATTSPAPVAPAATPSSASQPQPLVTTGSGGGACLDLGPLGVCLNL